MQGLETPSGLHNGGRSVHVTLHVESSEVGGVPTADCRTVFDTVVVGKHRPVNNEQMRGRDELIPVVTRQVACSCPS